MYRCIRARPRRMTAVRVHDKCATPHSYKLVALLKISELGAFASVGREGRGDETGTRGRSEDIAGTPGDPGDRGGRRGDVCGEGERIVADVSTSWHLALWRSSRVIE